MSTAALTARPRGVQCSCDEYGEYANVVAWFRVTQHGCSRDAISDDAHERLNDRVVAANQTVLVAAAGVELRVGDQGHEVLS